MAGGAIGGGGDMGRGSDICSIQCGPPKTAFAIAVLAIAVGLFALLAQALEGLQLYLCASVLLGTIGVAVVLTLCLREKKTITVAHAGAALDVPSERLAVTEPPVPRPHSALSQANFDSAPSTDQPTAAQPNLLFQSSNRNRKQKKSGFTCCGSWESSRSDIGAAALLLTQAGYAAGEMAGSAQLDAADGSPRSSPEAYTKSSFPPHQGRTMANTLQAGKNSQSSRTASKSSSPGVYPPWVRREHTSSRSALRIAKWAA